MGEMNFENMTVDEKLDFILSTLVCAKSVMQQQCKEIEVLKSKLEKAKTALNEIASWESGPIVNSGFDCPGNAETARKALEWIEL